MALVDVSPASGKAGAQQALARGDWATALEGLLAEQQRRPLTPVELDSCARAAYGAGEFELAIATWEQAHAECQRLGDRDGAAGAAATIAMFLMMETALLAPVRGWLSRAERLLEDRPESATTALIAMTRTYERFLCGDAADARAWAARAAALGAEHDLPVASALGHVALARLDILDGKIDDGLRLLDDAAVSVVSGELDPLAVGMVYCELICAMQGLAQYDRAEQWTEAMERWRHGHAFGAISGRCRVHRAEIFRLRGACDAAEQEALHACQELRPWMRREFGWPLTELGSIRLRRGDLDGAQEAFLAANDHGWDPQPGLALLRLAQGDGAGAATLIADALEVPRCVPSKERPPHGPLRRAPLLEARVEIALAVHDLPSARASAAELTDIGETYRSRALCASGSLARARVALASGDAPQALRDADDAVLGWTEVGAPYEAARARLVLADAHQALGHRERAGLESTTAVAALARIGAALPPGARAPATPGTDGDIPEPRPAPTGEQNASNMFRLDGDVRTVAFAGHTVLVHDLKGMRYLARLLNAPGREIHVLDLVSSETGAQPTRDRDLGPTLDAQAREAYKRRLREIDEDIDEATALGDGERVALAEADREYLVRELAVAFGVGGRYRLTGATSERARASVTRALRYALARIAAHHPPLAEHLRCTLRTGVYCAYEPDPRLPVQWDI